MSKQRKLGFYLTLKATVPHDQIVALSAKDQATLAYDAFGAIADRLTECGIDPDLVATAAWDLGQKLLLLDGSPLRVVRLSHINKGYREASNSSTDQGDGAGDTANE
jgi:hypothetical protein